MNAIQSVVVSAIFAVASLTPAAGYAQDQSRDITDGEVRKVEKDAGKVTIKHGEIRNLEMPAMTMAFPVRDKAMLDNIQAGDKIKFKVINEGGKMVVTEIRPGK
jgi:Cu/Ag efflux protein CusF